MKKTIGKFLSITLTLCLLIGAVPAVNVSAAIVHFVKFSYNDENLGWARLSNNATLVSEDAVASVYVFPEEGVLLDSITVKDTVNDKTVDAVYTGRYEDGYIYNFQMPHGDVDVNIAFSVDNAGGYYYLECGYYGVGTAKFLRNGIEFSGVGAVKAGDRIRFSNAVAGEGYRFDGDAYFLNMSGNEQYASDGFNMPQCDSYYKVEFKKLHNLTAVTRGGSVTFNRKENLYSGVVEENISRAALDDTVQLTIANDSSHNSDYKLRFVTESGNDVNYISRSNILYMPDEPVTVYLTFLKDSYDISCTADHGTLGYSAPDGTGAGKTVTLNANPDEGYGLKELYYTYTPEVGLDEVKTNIDVKGDLSFTVPEADVEVHAVFAVARRAQWLDGDGKLLDSATYIDGGELPTTDKIPTKEGGPDYSYEFTGWQAPAYYGTDLTVFRPNFDKLYAITVGNGTALPARAKAGDTVTLTADPAPNRMYHSGWRVTSGNIEINNNSFVMPDSSVELYAVYTQKKNTSVGVDFSDTKGYVGKPFTVSGSIEENGEKLNVGGTVTVRFTSGSYESEGAVSYTVPVVNGDYVCDVPALTAGNNYVWAEYSGDGEYGDALSMNTFNLYAVSAAELTVNLGEGNVKTTYNVCDELDVTDLSVWYYWMDGSEEYYPVTADMVSGFDNTKSGTQTLTVTSPYPTTAELSYNITMKKIYRTKLDEEINLDYYFSRDEEDSTEFGIGNTFKHVQLLGVQKKNDNTRDIRFVAVLNNKVVQDADEYGFIAAKGSTVAEAEGKLKGVTYATANNVYNCAGTSNKISGKYGVYSEATDYKYITLAVHGIGDSAVAARFYIKKGGKVYYSDYINKNNETKDICAVNWAAFEEGA